jgi:hypothetical protein
MIPFLFQLMLAQQIESLARAIPQSEPQLKSIKGISTDYAFFGLKVPRADQPTSLHFVCT